MTIPRRRLFRPAGSNETQSPADETILRLAWRGAETAAGYQLPHDAAHGAGHGRCMMRFASLILAVAFLFAGPSLAGSTGGGLPHTGSFAFNGAPVALVVAAIR
jgi:hypothetical protein